MLYVNNNIFFSRFTYESKIDVVVFPEPGGPVNIIGIVFIDIIVLF
mgnify:CR=1 FL=1